MSSAVRAGKKAALALFGLHASDRHWILAQLDDLSREHIHRELEQLHSICRNQSIDFRSLLTAMPERECESIFPGVKPELVREVLDALPDNTLLLVSLHFDWPGKEDYLLQRGVDVSADLSGKTMLKPKALAALKSILHKKAGIEDVASMLNEEDL